MCSITAQKARASASRQASQWADSDATATPSEFSARRKRCRSRLTHRGVYRMLPFFQVANHSSMRYFPRSRACLSR